MLILPKLSCAFFRTDAGHEPVREWLRELPPEERRVIGKDICKVQFNWPLGRPRVAHLRGELWEVRSRLATRIARVVFAIGGGQMVLLHGFIKKTRAISQSDLGIAQARWEHWKDAARK